MPVGTSTKRALILALLPGLVGCGGTDSTDGEEPAMTAPDVITVTSTAFQDGEPIPQRYSCEGVDTSPPLAWTGVPADAGALALVVDDPDAPRGTFTHWVVLDIAVEATSIGESELPPGGIQARNSTGKPGYAGPCPPSGTHHYRFTVYALPAATELPEGTALETALDAIDAAATARGRLVGTYRRSG